MFLESRSCRYFRFVNLSKYNWFLQKGDDKRFPNPIGGRTLNSSELPLGGYWWYRLGSTLEGLNEFEYYEFFQM